jgi:hypothetical protein
MSERILFDLATGSCDLPDEAYDIEDAAPAIGEVEDFAPKLGASF